MHGFLPFSQVYRVFIIPYNVWKCCIFNEFWVPEWTLIKRGIFLDAATIEDYVPDPDDAIFYEVVMEARETTDAYLVTGNIKHFPVKPYVVTPKEMLEILNENER